MFLQTRFPSATTFIRNTGGFLAIQTGKRIKICVWVKMTWFYERSKHGYSQLGNERQNSQFNLPACLER